LIGAGLAAQVSEGGMVFEPWLVRSAGDGMISRRDLVFTQLGQVRRDWSAQQFRLGLVEFIWGQNSCVTKLGELDQLVSHRYWRCVRLRRNRSGLGNVSPEQTVRSEPRFGDKSVTRRALRSISAAESGAGGHAALTQRAVGERLA
jgi:hypothetical protein